MRCLKKALVVSLLFGAGWAGNAVTSRFAHTHSATAESRGGATAPSKACIDREAMNANANLVVQLHDVRGQLTRAEQINRLTKLPAPSASGGTHPRLTTSNEDWSRMAQERTVRVRMPCSNWSDGSHFSVVNGGIRLRVGVTMHTHELRQRASVADLAPQEQEALSQAYARAHERTWESMRSICESNTAYKTAFEEATTPTPSDSDSETDGPVEPPAPPSAEDRINMCRHALLDMRSDTSRVAVTRVAELRAAGAGVDRSNNDEQRVMYALTMSASELEDEMTKSLGTETTRRALDNGVLCTHEIVYDVRGPAPRENEPEG
jgi:hypothetical protein